jgi:Spy/CpxP family protein refolding chaperone
MRTFTLISILWLTLLTSLPSFAAGQATGEREQWMTQMRQYKRTYFTKELELSRDQQNKFYPLYEEMEDQINKINDDARSMEKRVGEMTNPSDLEYEKATEAVYDSAVRCAQLERDYMDKFQNILSRKQLFKLKSVERKFSREVMKQHNRLRSKAKTASDK